MNEYPRKLLNKRSSSELLEEELNKMADELKDIEKIKSLLLPKSEEEAAV